MKNRIALIYSPGIFQIGLAHGLSTLAGYAQSIGLNSIQIDAAIEFERYLHSEEALSFHRPRGRSSVHDRLWRTLKYSILKHKHFHSRGDWAARQICMTNICNYYSAIYTDTIFERDNIFPRDYSVYSSKDLMPAAKQILCQNDHPLVNYVRSHLLPRLSNFKPRVIGLSVAEPEQLVPAFVLSYIFKKELPGSKIIIGGAWPNRIVDVIRSRKKRFFDTVDAYSMADGEPTLDGVNDWLCGNCEFSDIDNLITPYITRDIQAHFIDIRRQPMPIFDPTILSLHMIPIEVPIELTRGCYWGKCSFCSSISGIHERYREVDMSHVLRTIKYIRRKYHINHFILGTLGASPKLLSSFVDMLSKSRITILWKTWIRLEKGLTKDLLKKAYDNGCCQLSFAPESFSQNTLKLMKKGYLASHMIELLDYAKSLGIVVFINVMAGFPGEPLVDFEHTLSIAYQHKYRTAICPFRLLEGSEISKNPFRFGIRLRGKGGKDLEQSIYYEVKKKTPYYSWIKERSQFIRTYNKWFISSSNAIGVSDIFAFDEYR